MPDPILTLKGVTKHYGNSVAVAGIDLTIADGEFVALLGPSGCGKSTTLRMTAGLETPTHGDIWLRGRRINEDRPWRRHMPMVWQSLALFPHLSVCSNVEYGLKMRGLTASERRAKALEWLRRLRIDQYADRGVRELSGGEQQRVALARALILEPEILLLDEPLSALDAHLVVTMQAEISRLHGDLGITFLYVTHNQSEAFAMADRVVVMNRGRIEQVGTPREVYHSPKTRFVAEFIGSNNILRGTVSEIYGACLHVATAVGAFQVARREDTSFAKGEAVWMVVSADRIDVANDSARLANAVSAEVVGEQFVGAVVTLHFQLSDGSEFRVQKQQSEVEMLHLSRGRRVRLSWQPEHGFVLPSH